MDWRLERATIDLIVLVSEYQSTWDTTFLLDILNNIADSTLKLAASLDETGNQWGKINRDEERNDISPHFCWITKDIIVAIHNPTADTIRQEFKDNPPLFCRLACDLSMLRLPKT